MKAKLLNLLPGVRWTPHDIPNQNGAKPKTKTKSRNPFSSKHASSSKSPPHHGSLRPRKSTISLTSQSGPDLDARTHAQGQSAFFATLPLEIRKMVYEYVMGAEMVHLTLGSKRRYGHFVCEEGGGYGDGDERKECGCRVLVGGKEGVRLDGACVRVLGVCRRMYSESISHLYRPHAFSLLHITHLLYLPSSLPPQRLSQIRILRLRWAIRALPYLRRGPSQRLAYHEDTANWVRGWNIIAGMEGLRDLYVVINDPSPQGIWEQHWLELEEQLLEPVKAVVSPRCAEVMLPFVTCRTDWDLGESRVVLRRQEGWVEDEEQD